MEPKPVHVAGWVATALLAVGMAIPTALSQTAGPSPRSDRPTRATAGFEPVPEYDVVGARLGMLSDVLPQYGPRGGPFRGESMPPGIGATGVVALLRFDRRLSDSRRAALRREGIRFLTDGSGLPIRTEHIYLARVSVSSISTLPAIPGLVRAEAAWAPASARPLDVTTRKAGASPLRRAPGLGLDGTGTTIADIDGSFFIYHPQFFRADGGRWAWLDVDGDETFDPGRDGVDLDEDGDIDRNERLEVLDATLVGRGTPRNDDDRLQPDRDWVYVDANGDGRRNFGFSAGFDESTPAYGEPIFAVDDVDRDGALERGERLVRLDSSKFERVVVDDTVYRRGDDLIRLGVPERGRRISHGTAVASILVGGQPAFHDRVGVAPGADLVGYVNGEGAEERLGDFGLVQSYLEDADDHGVDVLLHEWTNLVATPQDGSSNLERAMDASRRDGMPQITPLGNLNLARKHVRRQVEPGRTEELEIRVPRTHDDGGTSRRHERLWMSLRWRTDHRPVLEWVTPNGTAKTLAPSDGKQTIGRHRLSVSSEVSPKGTRLLLVAAWNSSEGLAPGTWRLRVRDVRKRDTLVGRLVDAYTDWDVGIHWNHPTRDRGTLTFPATADSAFAVAAYAGRRDAPADGPGSEVGELRYFSGRGPRIDGIRSADIAAPDDPIAALGVDASRRMQGYGTSWFRGFGGTSGAAPHVAGAVALLTQKHPSWGPDRLEERLVRSADPDGLTRRFGAAPNRAWGHGKLRTYRAATGSPPPASGRAPLADLEVERRDGRLRFDGSESRPRAGETLEYRFDLQNDGRWETDWQSTPRTSAAADDLSPGRHPARLEVRDGDGRRSGDLAFYRRAESDGDVGRDVDTGGTDGGEPGPEVPPDFGCGRCSQRSGDGNVPIHGLVTLALVAYLRRYT